MKLSFLLRGLPVKKLVSYQEKDIQHIAFDSRCVEPGSLFVCIKGFKEDGHRFAREAVRGGAKAVVCQKTLPLKTPQIIVSDSRYALSFLSDRFFGHPSHDLHCIAITGTNGKTTTTYLTAQLLQKTGYPTCFFTTVHSQIGQETFSLPLTTSDPWTLHHLLRKAKEESMKIAVIEVSSHAIALQRTAHVRWQGAGITNITQDHLDFHKSMKAYALTKLSLFESLKGRHHIFAAANLDDPWQKNFRQMFPGKTHWYGFEKKASFQAREMKVTSDGFSVRIQTPRGELKALCPLRGRFQVYNLLCALSLVWNYETDLRKLKRAIAEVKPVPGRMEPVDAGQPFTVLVDYAHTPDALEKVLAAAAEWTAGRLICVFGCGGDRDPDKRPKMGSVAAKRAHLCIVTSDNPRTEDPEKIIQDILKGIPEDKKLLVIPDRKKAIGKAIRLARRGDTVLIAGKGHETYQILKDRTIHFDDREVARQCLQK